jgi:hypothetical protein
VVVEAMRVVLLYYLVAEMVEELLVELHLISTIIEPQEKEELKLE